MFSEWKCKSCFKKNISNMKYCDHCGCPKTKKSYITSGWKQQLNHQRGMPTENISCSREGFTDITYIRPRTSPCPSCKMHMYITSPRCPHCNYKLKLQERHALIDNYQNTQAHGFSLAVLFYPAIFIFILVLLYVSGNL